MTHNYLDPDPRKKEQDKKTDSADRDASNDSDRGVTDTGLNEEAQNQVVNDQEQNMPVNPTDENYSS